jgi:transcriptional regulator with XRE-family HTH domain
MKKQAKFGELLREYRKPKMALSTFAGKLRMSPQYVSDVELSRRNPFNEEMIRKAVVILELNKAQTHNLFRAYVIEQGAVKLKINSPESAYCAAMLARVWDKLSPKDMESITEFIDYSSRVKEV